MPDQSLADMCPLPELFVVDLHLGETSDGDGDLWWLYACQTSISESLM
jgi:hypothetical protein